MTDIDQSVSHDQSSEEGHAYLSAAEAADRLGVKVPTLYAYTSRGLVRSVAGPRGRARRYLRADIDRLRIRRDARAGHGPAAAGALRFGEPVLDTRITSIDSERGPSYRGHRATDLAEADTPFEAVCELLWGGALQGLPKPWRAVDLEGQLEALSSLLSDAATPIERLSLVVPLLASRDPGRFATEARAVRPRARVLMRGMAGAFSLGRGACALTQTLAAPDLASALGCALAAGDSSDAVRAINRALVLCADHELNASTFAARVAASTGADLYACVAAALATLSGPRHGGAADRIEALIDEIGEPGRAQQVVHERARRGEAIEGFGHPLYPGGDPRGLSLLELAAALSPRARAVRVCRALVEELDPARGGPTVDLGLVALCGALGLARGSALGLFAMARCAGWVAHSLEQYAAGYLLRPRARYLERD